MDDTNELNTLSESTESSSLEQKTDKKKKTVRNVVLVVIAIVAIVVFFSGTYAFYKFPFERIPINATFEDVVGRKPVEADYSYGSLHYYYSKESKLLFSSLRPGVYFNKDDETFREVFEVVDCKSYDDVNKVILDFKLRYGRPSSEVDMRKYFNPDGSNVTLADYLLFSNIVDIRWEKDNRVFCLSWLNSNYYYDRPTLYFTIEPKDK